MRIRSFIYLVCCKLQCEGIYESIERKKISNKNMLTGWCKLFICLALFFFSLIHYLCSQYFFFSHSNDIENIVNKYYFILVASKEDPDNRTQKMCKIFLTSISSSFSFFRMIHIGVPSLTMPASTITPITIGSRELKICCGKI